jgi:hypothetical protein
LASWEATLDEAVTSAAARGPAVLSSALEALEDPEAGAARWGDRLSHPLWRAVAREALQCRAAITSVRADAAALGPVLRGEARADAALREVLLSLQQGATPGAWAAAAGGAAPSPALLVSGLARSWAELARVVIDLDPAQGWDGLGAMKLAALRAPEAALAASKQCAARELGVALQALHLHCKLYVAAPSPAIVSSATCLVVAGASLSGARVESNGLKLLEKNEKQPLAALVVEWKTEPVPTGMVDIPVYSNDNRSNEVAAVPLSVQDQVDRGLWSLRSVAITFEN